MNIVFIKNDVHDISFIADSLLSNTKYIVIESNDNYTNLVNKINDLNINNFEHIGLMMINNFTTNFNLFNLATEQNVLQDVEYLDNSLNSWNDFIDFLKTLKMNYNCLIYDLITCNIFGNNNWSYIINKIQNELNIQINSSSNLTGMGGDWILESNNLNLINLYFNENIQQYNYSLDFQSSQSNFISRDHKLYSNNAKNLKILNTSILPANVIPTLVCGSLSANFALILGSNGKVYGCGINNNGQLGDGSETNRTASVEMNMSLLPQGVTAVKIACGDAHTVVLGSNGKVYACGANNFGQLGDGTTTKKTTLVEMNMSILPNGVTATSIAAAYYHTIVLASNGKIYVCGINNYGQLGVGNLTYNTTTLMEMNMSILPTNVTATSIASGYYHVIILGSNGKVYGCGYNNNGLLGTGTTSARVYNLVAMNMSILPAGITVTSISCTSWGSFVLGSNGKVYGCGWNSNGELGDGTTTQRISLVEMNISILPTNVSVMSINGGSNHMLLLGSNGKVYGCGLNSNCQLGDGSSTNRTTLVGMDFSYLPPGFTVSSVSSSGNNFTLVIGTNNLLYGCGDNTDRPMNTYYYYTLFKEDLNFTKLAFTKGDTLALINNGTIYGYGSNGYGQLGDGTTTIKLILVQMNLSILPAGVTATSIACGDGYTIVLGSNGKVYGCGRNDYGQLGDGSTSNRTTLVEMNMSTLPAGVTATSIACGELFTVILGSNGMVYGCGYNLFGQLGNGTTSNTTTLVQMNMSILPVGVTPTSIACGFNDTLVLGSNGKIYGCGSNGSGILGDGTSTTRTTLVAMNMSTLPTGVTATSIACGSYSTVFLGSNGKLYGCGNNTFGQLGDGSTTNRTTLVAMNMSILPTGVTATSIACGLDYTTIFGSNGLVYSCGNNGYGQLGDGSTTNRTTLVNTKIINNNGLIYNFGIINPTLSNFTDISKTYEDVPFTITNPTSNSSGSFSYTSSNASVATISGNTVTIVGAGNTTITATQSETSNYFSGTITCTLTVSKANITLSSFSNLSKTYGDSPFTITAPTSNGSGSFSYTSSNTSVATVSGNTVTIVGAGNTTITATQSETSNYFSGTITCILTISKANTTLSNFIDISKTYGDVPFTITNPTSNSSGSFSYTSSNTSVATISGNTVTIVGSGNTTITASQEETGNYFSGTIACTLTISKANPTLSNFSNLSKTQKDSPLIIEATSNSSGSLSYTSSNTSVATISGNTVTIVGLGNTTITASQEETSNYFSGTITCTLTVTKIFPTLYNFPNLFKTQKDIPFTITAPISNSSGSFTYTNSNSSVATILKNNIAIVNTGNTTITASQEETGNYFSGTITCTLTVSLPKPTLFNFTNLSKSYGNDPFTITPPTSNSSGSFSYASSNTSVATISGNIVTIVGAGNTTITATQSATNNYSSVTITCTLTVSKIKPTLSNFTNISKNYGDIPFTVTAPTSNSLGSFTYTSSNNLVATISGNTVTIVGAGNTTITASQEETSNYFSETITTGLTVSKINPTLSNFPNISKIYGDNSFTITPPTSNSVGPFIYTSSNNSVAMIYNNIVTILGTGTTTITANQLAMGNFLSGTFTCDLTISNINPTLSNFANISKNYGDIPFSITGPISNSSGSFAYTSSNTSVATISGNTVTIVGSGNTTITANQSAFGNYSSATITCTLTVSKKKPTLYNFINLSKTYGDVPFSITNPISNSSGSFSYTSSNTSIATISGNTITIIGSGSTVISANQSETDSYSSGTITCILSVSKLSPTLSGFTNISKIYGNLPFTITAPTSNSSGSFSYTSSNTSVATIYRNTIKMVGVGNATITANQGATSNCLSGSITCTLTVS